MRIWRSSRFAWCRILASALVLISSLPFFSAKAQGGGSLVNPSEQAELMLQNLSPEERVGQLFLVTFRGTAVSPDLPIYDLIHNHHIGGIVLQSKMDNIVPLDSDPASVPEQGQKLIRLLQETEHNSSIDSQINPTTGLNFMPNYIPLFIATQQEGDGSPFDQFLSGLTELPSQMAVGATWEPDLAAKTGALLGKELSSLGINLLLGPSLDVLDLPQIELTKNLGIRTFGGDPYWVSEMGRAFIRGVHSGSGDKIAVAGKHFPGHGGSDRLPEEEVATVRKSLDELKSIDLAPFFAVTGNAIKTEETADALISSHIRYQGLQGNIRATTRPVSLDPQALNLLMELPGLSSWRDGGGVLISDDLGNNAIRRFYELTNQTFDPRRVALNAFLAGNDILYIADFTTSNNTDAHLEAVRTLEFFAQKYREDAAFAQRVDESVRRILRLKYRLYPNFEFESVLPDPSALQNLGTGNDVAFEVARNSATLLSPSQTELDTTIPDPPNQNDRIVFIVDTRSAQQCSVCLPNPSLSQKSLQDAVVRLYGPQTGGLVSLNNLSSYSFENLAGLLKSKTDQPDLEYDLSRAHWIVMAMLGDSGDISAFNILRSFLTERPDLFQQKRLIVFSLTAPYYLDATTISKLSAYYGLYSKASPFIDAAAYLLFGELRAASAPPVSIPGIGYNLNEALFPDPEILIPLEFDLMTSEQAITGTVTPEPPPTPEFRIGDVLPLRAGIVYDHNRNPVPDGTPVNFIFSYGSESTSIRQTAYTQGGIARTTFAVVNPGTLEITAESESARSAALKVDIPLPNGVVATLTPTFEPTPTASPVPPTPTPAPLTAETPTPEPPPQPGVNEWLIALLVSLGFSFTIYKLAAQIGSQHWGIRAGLLSLCGGLIAYCYLVAELPGSRRLLDFSLPWSVILVSFGGGLLGLAVGLCWRAFEMYLRRRKTDRI